ncbi:MAG: branched-chain amino acid ABC transporter permease [Acidobacteriota bacterium]
MGPAAQPSGSGSRQRWWIRDAIGLAVVIILLAIVSSTIERIPIPGMAYYFRIIVLAGINVILAVSLNIINGHAGQFSLGHAGFMAVGAYTSAFFTFFYFNPYLIAHGGDSSPVLQNALFLVALLIGGLAAAVAGYIVGIPSLRLRGDYLAVVTLGFGEIIRVIVLNIDKVGAARGLAGIPNWSSFFWVYFFAWLTAFVSFRLVRSKIGRAFFSVREDEIAAEAMGINTTRYKVQAFVLGSFFAGIAGGLLAHYLAYLNPSMFTFIRSIEVVVMVVLGGMGSISGAVIAAIGLTFLLEQLRNVKDWLHLSSDPRMVIYALLLIGLMLTRRQGILGRKEIWDVMPRRKDVIPEKPDEEGEGKLDDTSGPPVQ